eukprot:CAMPEP_0185020974 /NCGR_PEP_ID=MMETSP1103-20130426/3622_1 /TAXON_ID=36769 /ORGANISM="Paraphysomonas bandaiensis, Strain Caron Lab Isolate" /LENGTH=812 /DNA_ID=CAMNT_0027552209 /DNA_START=188 /DNA_END=2626 /DNA_ORIENTATION=-
MENEALSSQHSQFDVLRSYVPVVAWLMWMFVGMVFYAVHDDFGWALGLYMSVNIGWSMGWAVPISPAQYNSPSSMLFSIFHSSIGVIFFGVMVIFIARELTDNKDSWSMQVLKRQKLEVAIQSDGIYDDIEAYYALYYPKLKILLWFICSLVFGVIWSLLIVPEWDIGDALDFTLSTLSSGGYKAIPNGLPSWKYVITAFYAATGVPLMALSLGLILSMLILAPEDLSLLDKLSAPITTEEIEFMTTFGLEDGDGTIDKREFTVLTVVRIGAASPELIREINERFRMLDRRNHGQIKCDDIIHERRKRRLSSQYIFSSLSRKMSTFTRSKVHNSEEETEKSMSSDYLSGGSISIHGVSPTSRLNPVEPLPVADEDIDDRDNVCDEVENIANSSQTTDSACLHLLEAESGEEDTSSQCDTHMYNHSTAVEECDSGKYHPVTAKKCFAENDEPRPSMKEAVLAPMPGSLKEAKQLKYSTKAVASSMDSMQYNRNAIIQGVLYVFRSSFMRSALVWILWIVSGTIFYSVHQNLSLAKGLYTSISVGYCVFWTELSQDTTTKVYTIFHYMFGTVGLASIMALMANSLANSKNEWYVDAMLRQKVIEAAATEGIFDDIYAGIAYYLPKCRAHIAFLLWTAVGVIVSCATIKWSFIQALYFSWSAMTTGGFWTIPQDSPDRYYLYAGIYLLVGAPLMALACGMSAHYVVSFTRSQAVYDRLAARITAEEINTMKLLNMENGDGDIDPTEFVILMLVRIGALQPQLIALILDRFDELDVGKKGCIAYSDITQVPQPLLRRNVVSGISTQSPNSVSVSFF